MLVEQRAEGEWEVTSERVWTPDQVKPCWLREGCASGGLCRKGATPACPEWE